MDFSNWMYAAVTKQFFEYLVENIHFEFEKRVNKVGHQYGEDALVKAKYTSSECLIDELLDSKTSPEPVKI